MTLFVAETIFHFDLGPYAGMPTGFYKNIWKPVVVGTYITPMLTHQSMVAQGVKRLSSKLANA